ncbi:amino acid/amide ABC transporter substrate-binding protein, HAAT family [Actinacidiphila yanglinensis]|uniref:Amino acid/amide ABC transporter substrate-binding protein, HAAT family n=1 Tax=Actinacidiphila yanglinensis TaxID=310779 RepID=A0A1H5XVB5_9ACTN|nr:substrate-binding domain-containing protein [Actinacidiphila yanglinensis]SEG15602.1 amino acid/amide ABC transporter substrate-binding protein, HAAT family [Actinacidiphila yanglinensis]
MTRSRGTGPGSRPFLALCVLGASALLAGCSSAGTAGSSSGSGGGSAHAPVKVGLVYSRTGPLAAYGTQYEQGFKAGLSYATGGTGKVDGHEIQVTEEDDTGDPATAVADAKGLIGKGYKILAGTTDSGVALQLAPLAAQNQTLYIAGPAATDGITGINKYTFRSGRESYQDIAAAGSLIGDPAGKKIVVLTQNSAFGQGNVTAVKAVLGTGSGGAKVDSVLAPPSATDLTPFARQVKAAKPDLVYVAWAGATAPALWTALDQQGVLGSTKVVTGLAGVASYPIFGSAGGKISFIAHYFPGAGAGNKVETAMLQGITKAGGTPDLFSPDGFTAAQMIVRAIQGSPTDTSAMVSSLEGWTFAGPKGSETVRAADHALVQPMFQARLTGTGASAKPALLAAVPGSSVAPPAKKMAG